MVDNLLYFNVETLAFPLTQNQVIAENPGISFPAPFSLPNGYVEVERTVPPEYDETTHKLIDGVPEFIGDVAYQTWSLKKLTAAEKRETVKKIEEREQAERAALKVAATAHRWQVETGGVVLPNGVKVKTAKDDQDRITATIAGMEAVGMESVDFKADSGWVTLTLRDIQAIRAVIALHVQACFSAERAHHEAIDALDVAALAKYDITQAWPAQGSV